MFKLIHNMKVRDERGFTLVELLIVIAIIAILAAIAIPQFSAYRQRGVRSSMVADARNAATALETAFSDCQAYPTGTIPAGTTVANFGEGPLGSCTNFAGVSISASKGNTITITSREAGTWKIEVSNNDAGARWSPLTMTGGANATEPGCKWQNDQKC